MRIAQIAPPWFTVPPADYGGIETVVATLTEGLAARGHDVTLFASGGSSTSGELVTSFERAPDAALMGNTWIDAYHAIVSLDVLLRGKHYDVIHDHSGVVALALAAFATDAPVVSTLHNPWSELSRRCYLLLEQRVHTVAISNAQRVDHSSLRNATVIYNGIDVDSYPFRAQKGDHLVFIGRANPDKGPMAAIEISRRSGLSLALVIKRQEPIEVSYWEDMVAPTLHSGVDVYEKISHEEKADLLSRARAMLFPIRWREPFGLVMVESMACGTPVITSPVGAAPEVVIDGVTGYLRQSIEEYVDALSHISEISPETCRDHVAQHFSQEVMVTDYEVLYRRIMTGD